MRVTRSILWLALIAATPAFAQQNLSKVSDDVHTEAGQQYGSLATVSGDIHVAGKVQAKGVHSVSGDISIDTGATVADVATTSGDLKVADNAKTGALKSVSGNLTLGRDVVVGGDVTSVSGNIFANRGSKIGGDITSVSGSVGLVQTQVEGSIHFVSSDITVGVGSHVWSVVQQKKAKYGRLDRPPRIVIGPNAVVDGALEFQLPVQLYVHSTAKTGPISGATPIAFSTPTPPKD